ncbi:hypothetical protein T09_6725 [Trichinella sp. T9]|nr:hypothetical protein T09_7678 [Trichinella sp. T9]KRX51690.1 hypothetical protein T09_2329 [Trichinella sp. T9]KRX51855.1 hypothetical protein T09_7659 [Trichinella sp. T9]KRX52876.1 hypothetical protein T09_6725 [Trichinella sp. T9]
MGNLIFEDPLSFPPANYVLKLIKDQSRSFGRRFIRSGVRSRTRLPPTDSPSLHKRTNPQTVYVNYYTFLELQLRLKEMRILSCGAVRPKQTSTDTEKGVIAFAWYDNRRVLATSTNLGMKPKSTVKRWDGRHIAMTNAWQLYKTDSKMMLGTSAATMDVLRFSLQVSQFLCLVNKLVATSRGHSRASSSRPPCRHDDWEDDQLISQ